MKIALLIRMKEVASCRSLPIAGTIYESYTMYSASNNLTAAETPPVMRRCRTVDADELSTVLGLRNANQLGLFVHTRTVGTSNCLHSMYLGTLVLPGLVVHQ